MPQPRFTRRDFIHLALLATGSLLAGCRPGKEPNPTSNPPISSTITKVPASPTTPPKSTTAIEGKVMVLATGLDFPEGPAFDPQGNLWFVELNGGNLVSWSEGKVKRYPTGGRPNGMGFDHKGRAWMCDSGQNKIRRFDPTSNQWETMAEKIDGQPLQSPNDLSFDAQGNLLFTCPNFADNNPTGYVVCLTPAGKLTKIIDGIYRPNGLDIVDGGKALVVADTWQKTLLKGSWDAATCTWQDPQPWAKVGGSEGPDGMIPGADGLLYVAIYGDGVIKVVNEDGQISKVYKIPGSNPTNVAVDPAGKLGLVVTETEKGQLLSLPEVQPGVAIFDGGVWWP
jgi:gluconolactonase